MLIKQAKAFETTENDSEEVNELDDDELNDLLARGDDELAIFSRMDRERPALRQQQWRASGETKPLPPPLMIESELPAFYRRDMDADIARAAQEQEAEAEGRGRRAKNDVRYTDGLTDDQWLTAMDASDDDPDEAADRKRSRIDQRAERKRLNALLAEAEAQGKPLDAGKLLEENSSAPAVPKSAKKRARPSMSATPSVMGDDGSSVSRDAWRLCDADGRNAARSNRLHHRHRTLASCRSCTTKRTRSSRS